ncbi:cyclic nucleotide-binding/CBS domain-containing protein [Salinigranum sp.]|uniref:CBS domain-containing protein n=1 Tax=Salinigranum sp. TaxID=1966351 RepID=UPI0035692B2A
MNRDSRTRVEEVMSTPLETISSSASVTEAAQVMRDHTISALVVTSSPPGIVTSTDVLGVVADGRDPAETAVREVMTAGVESVPPDLLIEEVAAMMTSLGIKHLPVVDGDDYVGMVSSTDVTAELA